MALRAPCLLIALVWLTREAARQHARLWRIRDCPKLVQPMRKQPSVTNRCSMPTKNRIDRYCGFVSINSYANCRQTDL